jgi:beta-galactosidase
LQLRQLIRQHYNNPSVLFWGLYNEIEDTAPFRQLVSTLNTTAKAEDSTRLTVAASNLSDPALAIHQITDLTAYNKYKGWYSGNIGDFSDWLNSTIAANPTVPIGMGEWGAGGSINQHMGPSTRRNIRTSSMKTTTRPYSTNHKCGAVLYGN